MEREKFIKVMQEVLDSLPEVFRSRISNVAVLVEESRTPVVISIGQPRKPFFSCSTVCL